MRPFYLICVAMVVLSCACRTVPTDSSPTNRLTSIRGVAIAEDADSLTERNAGILVEVLGTPYRAETDRNGLYVIEEIPEGTYDLVFSLPDHDSASLQQVTALAPRGFTGELLTSVLIRSPRFAINLDSGIAYPNVRRIYMTIDDPPSSGLSLVQFVGRTREVGPEYEGHAVALQKWIENFGTTLRGVNLSRRDLAGSAPFAHGAFAVGDSAYVVFYCGRGSMYDPRTKEKRYMNLRTRSNVIGFVVR